MVVVAADVMVYISVVDVTGVIVVSSGVVVITVVVVKEPQKKVFLRLG